MPKRFLLDTHVVVDIATSAGFGDLPATVRRILEDPDVDLLLSVVSEAEIAVKARIGKLDLTRDELNMIYANAAIISYPLRRQHTQTLFELPMHHKDPFDRLIISTALSDDLPVISRDKRFNRYRALKLIW